MVNKDFIVYSTWPSVIPHRTGSGVTFVLEINLKQFVDQAHKHSKSAAHLKNTARLSEFGTINIAAQISSRYHLNFEKHNETFFH